MLRVPVVFTAMIIGGFASASPQIPLAWETVTITIENRGGASVAASRSSDGVLDTLAVSIRGKKVDIPRSCFPSDIPVYLNLISFTYGQFEGNEPYWVLKIAVDYEAAFDDVGTYHLILLEDRVKLSYIEYAESERVLVDGPPLCGSW